MAVRDQRHSSEVAHAGWAGLARALASSGPRRLHSGTPVGLHGSQVWPHGISDGILSSLVDELAGRLVRHCGAGRAGQRKTVVHQCHARQQGSTRVAYKSKRNHFRLCSALQARRASCWAAPNKPCQPWICRPAGVRPAPEPSYSPTYRRHIVWTFSLSPQGAECWADGEASGLALSVASAATYTHPSGRHTAAPPSTCS